MDSQYPINLSEVIVTYADESTLECAELLTVQINSPLTVFLDNILQNILSGDHRDSFTVSGTDVEITRSLIRKIEVTIAPMKG